MCSCGGLCERHGLIVQLYWPQETRAGRSGLVVDRQLRNRAQAQNTSTKPKTAHALFSSYREDCMTHGSFLESVGLHSMWEATGWLSDSQYDFN